MKLRRECGWEVFANVGRKWGMTGGCGLIFEAGWGIYVNVGPEGSARTFLNASFAKMCRELEPEKFYIGNTPQGGASQGVLLPCADGLIRASTHHGRRRPFCWPERLDPRTRNEADEESAMRSGWMRLVRTAAAMLALAGGLWASGAGAAEVKNVKAEYSWPWQAEIHYEVVGTIMTNCPLVVTATDRTKNVTYTADAYALSGDTGHNTGAHCLTWDMDKQGLKIDSSNVVFTVEYLPMYSVVDLSGGADASSYPVTYLEAIPSEGFNTDAYKTTKLVLRRIEAGTFMMCGSYQVTLSKPFYMGLFEVTQKQYTLVMGENPSMIYKGDMLPVNQINYNTARGGSAGAKWPANNAVDASTFLGKLRARTGLVFDLPTEAQWEYACRAGTTSAYNNGGNTYSDLSTLGNYAGSRDSNWSVYTSNVGSYLPNAWGLYDMHGNVWEWCLDWLGELTNGVTDPKGPSSGEKRVCRGGSFCREYRKCTSSYRGYYLSDGLWAECTLREYGFRIACPLEK